MFHKKCRLEEQKLLQEIESLSLQLQKVEKEYQKVLSRLSVLDNERDEAVHECDRLRQELDENLELVNAARDILAKVYARAVTESRSVCEVLSRADARLLQFEELPSCSIKVYFSPLLEIYGSKRRFIGEFPRHFKGAMANSFDEPKIQLLESEEAKVFLIESRYRGDFDLCCTLVYSFLLDVARVGPVETKRMDVERGNAVFLCGFLG